ncbi:hypothetical protein, partial [Paraburkholderia humisilvae]
MIRKSAAVTCYVKSGIGVENHLPSILSDDADSMAVTASSTQGYVIFAGGVYCIAQYVTPRRHIGIFMRLAIINGLCCVPRSPAGFVCVMFSFKCRVVSQKAWRLRNIFCEAFLKDFRCQRRTYSVLAKPLEVFSRVALLAKVPDDILLRLLGHKLRRLLGHELRRLLGHKMRRLLG